MESAVKPAYTLGQMVVAMIPAVMRDSRTGETQYGHLGMTGQIRALFTDRAGDMYCIVETPQGMRITPIEEISPHDGDPFDD